MEGLVIVITVHNTDRRVTLFICNFCFIVQHIRSGSSRFLWNCSYGEFNFSGKKIKSTLLYQSAVK